MKLRKVKCPECGDVRMYRIVGAARGYKPPAPCAPCAAKQSKELAASVREAREAREAFESRLVSEALEAKRVRREQAEKMVAAALRQSQREAMRDGWAAYQARQACGDA